MFVSSSKPLSIAALCLGLCATPTAFAASAAAAHDGEEEIELLDVSDCDAVFGDENIWGENADYRASRLHTFHQARHGLEIQHSVARWSRPVPLRMTGLDFVGVELVETEDEHDASTAEELVALVELSEPLDSRCKPGVYAVSADDSLGRDARVLAVAEYGVLIEQQGRLALFQKPGEARPPVRMVWRSGYQVVMEEKGSASAAKSTASKKPKKRKAKRRTRRKK